MWKSDLSGSGERMWVTSPWFLHWFMSTARVCLDTVFTDEVERGLRGEETQSEAEQKREEGEKNVDKRGREV